MRVALAGERVNERHVVGQRREMREHVGNHLASLAAGAERILRTGKISSGSLERHRQGRRPAANRRV